MTKTAIFSTHPCGEPISRTEQYRKITKPLLERQRRRRINSSLDQLKEILISSIQRPESKAGDGENARLEKADILELTVRHLQRLQQQFNERENGEDNQFREGFVYAASEVSKALAKTPNIDVKLGSSVMVHLGKSLNQIKKRATGNLYDNKSVSSYSPRPHSPDSTTTTTTTAINLSPRSYQYSPYTPPSSPEYSSSDKNVWRPW